MKAGVDAARSAPELPPARFAACFCTAFAALGLLWMPWVLLRQVDAFLGFQTPGELGRDVALALLLLTLPAALLTLLALGVQALVARLRSAAAARTVAWSVLLLPLAWLCVWQFGSASRAWLSQVTGSALTLTATGRLLALVALLAISVLLLRGQRLSRLLARMAALLRGLHGPALLLLGAAAVWLLLHPPRLMTLTPPASGPVGAKRPDVYLITIDTLAAEDAAVCGDGPTTMPRLRALAARASCFDRHYASSNFTTPSTATMETGALPWTHWGVQIVAKMALGMHGQTLASQLRAQGYEAHSISANLMASPRHHGSDDEYTTQTISPSPSLGLKPRVALSAFPDTTLPFWLSGLIPLLDTLDVHLFPERSPFAPEHTYQAARALLERAAQGQRPQFMWLHTLPPHDPYLPPPSTKYKLLPQGELDRWSQLLGMTRYVPDQQALIDKHRLRYREAIMGADQALGSFLDELDRRGKLDGAMVIITADHGESFERGYLGHAGEWLHEAVIRVPLVIKLPGQKAGRVVHTPVSLADVVPTVADVLGLPPPPAADGRSLKPALQGDELAQQPVFSMAMEQQSRFRPLRAGHYAVIDGPHKLVLDLGANKTELYDLAADPHERRDLSATDAATAARLRQLLEQRLAAAEKKRAAQFDKP
ncbi:arylsulfatase A-like enzyme [Pelomonas saccharophila]|uniref:Arylsulfatase A-like enzyme n=1 Tax=Roseateles saccharophilus TaxID=304 RepID=A0ABU1YSM1_ROSSA|nr:sulfatase-like hydrolase/transferase [Roseateles saccharophilus]MDR7271859.1 arylsulfatase A-like enzyme [Roseateles saccharophilus]